MFTPVTDSFLEMTPVDFEKFCLHILENKTKGLNNVKICHNKIMDAYCEAKRPDLRSKTVAFRF